jgi:hypothetical protein
VITSPFVETCALHAAETFDRAHPQPAQQRPLPYRDHDAADRHAHFLRSLDRERRRSRERGRPGPIGRALDAIAEGRGK